MENLTKYNDLGPNESIEKCSEVATKVWTERRTVKYEGYLRHAKMSKKARKRAQTVLRNYSDGILQSSDVLTNIKSFLNSEHSQYIIKLVEDIGLLVYSITRARNKADWSMAIIGFIKLRCVGPLMSATHLDSLTKYFDKEFALEVQSSDDVFASMRDYLDKYEEVRNAPIFKKLYKFTMYAMSLSLFDKVGISMDNFRYNKIEQAAIRGKYYMGPDFIHSTLDTLLFICERGSQCMQTGSLDPIYHSGSKYEDWYTLTAKLKRDALYLGNPEPHGIDKFTFLSDLRTSIDKGRAIYKHACRLGDFEKSTVRHIVSDLEMILADQTSKKSARQNNKAPFSLLLYGGSSIMKSTFSDIIFFHYGKIFNLPLGDEFKFVRVFSDPFWSGHDSTQWFCVLDDVAALNPNKTPNGDPSSAEIIQIINNVGFCPNQAELADKGRTPTRFKCVVATTNTEHLNAYANYNNSLAIRRRLPYVIDIKPKPEYARNEVMMDPRLVPEMEDGLYPDYWHITVKRVIPATTHRTNQSAKLEIIGVYDSIYEFLKWFTIEAINHEGIQDKSERCNAIMRNIELCTKCKLPQKVCECETEVILQSAEQIALEEEYIGMSEALDANIERRADRAYDEGIIAYVFHYIINLGVIAFMDYSCFREGARWLYTFPVCRSYVNRHILDKVHHSRIMKTVLKRMGIRVEGIIGRIPLFVAICGILASGSLVLLAINSMLRSMWPKKKECKFDVEDMCNFTREEIGEYERSKSRDTESFDDNASTITYASNSMSILRKPGKPEEFRLEGANHSKYLDDGSPPKQDAIPIENVWYKDDYQTTSFDMTNLTKSYKGLPMQIVETMVQKNSIFIRCEYRKLGVMTVSKPTRGFCVAGHIYMFNNHSIPVVSSFSMKIVQSAPDGGVDKNIEVLVSQDDVKRFPNKDLAFIEIRNLPPGKDLSQLFCKESLRGGFKGKYLCRSEKGLPESKEVFNITYANEIFSPIGVISGWNGKIRIPTQNGDCGAVLLAESAYGPVILGIHFLWNEIQEYSSAIKVTDMDISKAIAAFDRLIVQSAFPVLSAPSVHRGLVELHRKSPVRYIEEGTANVYGSIPGFRARMKSGVRNSLMNTHLRRYGYTTKHCAPDLKSYKPWRRALLDMVKPVTKLDNAILKECTDAYIKDIMDGMTDNDLDDVHVYDMRTAINGAAGVAYVDKINRNTSAGNPWKKSKKYFIRSDSPSKRDDKYFKTSSESMFDSPDDIEFTDEIMDRVADIEERYHNGFRYMPVFNGNLKDEAVSYLKAAIGKTRVFTGAPLDWTITVRKHLLSVIRLIQNNKYLFEAAPGIVAQSTAWGEMREYLAHFGEDQIIAGDYAKFDKTMPSTVILAAFDVIYAICKAANYSVKQLMVVWGIAEDTAFPCVDFNGDLIELYGSNPSGHPLTVIINSIANSLYMRYCYRVLNPNKEVLSFKLFVHLMTYGDDNVMGVSKSIPWFNHTSIQKVLADVGITYTMADKESISIPYINIKDVSFLKRKWRWDEDVRAYLCPLEEESIEKMLMVGVKSRTITDEAQCIDIIETAIREYFFYGKKLFAEKREMLREVAIACELDLYFKKSTFPTWNQLNNEFWQHSGAPIEV